MLSLRMPSARWRWAAGFVAAMALALGYATQVASAEPSDDATPAFSASQLADAIIYQQGPAAPLLAELERPTLEWTTQLQQSRQVILRAIDTDPQWGASFASRVQSGDPIAIEGALDDLALHSRKAMDGWLGADNIDRAIEMAEAGVAFAGLVWHRWVIIYRYIIILRHFWITWSWRWVNLGRVGGLIDELTVRTIATRLRR